MPPVRLAATVPASSKLVIVGDHDGDGLPDLTVKFSRAALDPLLSPGTRSLEVTGSLSNGDRFVGADQVRVIRPSGEHPTSSVAPNPFNPSGVLAFTTARPGPVRITVFDLQGRLVRTLMETPYLPGGMHEVEMDGHGDRGEWLSSGIYFYRVQSPDGTLVGRFSIMK